ncbi:MAG: NTP transferase domain-containing protein [Candidatus Omnitrophica bacterium]|nr:NTP transferase domain-containing protein [Candidatus Omnitrophota bacterium]
MKATKTKIFGLILAGGYSRRMGRDKGLLDFNGRPQIEYVDGLLRKHCSRVFLSKRKEQKPYKRIAWINDAKEFSGIGPLGGILSAMKEYPDMAWFIAACDLPFITDDTIQTLFSNRDPQKTATAFMSTQDDLPEPLCAIWEGHAYNATIKMFQEGVHCPRRILINSDTHLIKQTNAHWLDNINTSQEYDRIVDLSL